MEGARKAFDRRDRDDRESELRGARRRPIVGVMGSGTIRHDELAIPLGRWIALRGCHLLTGGGGGVMEAVGEGFASVRDREGLSIGILPAGPPPGYPNRWVDIAIRTHLGALGEDGASPNSRNHLNVLSSEVVVALPGGSGTRSEIELAERYGRPLFRLDPSAGAPAFSSIDALGEAIERAIAGPGEASHRDE